MLSDRIAKQDSSTLQAMMKQIDELNEDEVHINKVLSSVNKKGSKTEEMYYNIWNRRLIAVRQWKSDYKQFIADLLKLMETK